MKAHRKSLQQNARQAGMLAPRWYSNLSFQRSTGQAQGPCDAARNAGGRRWVGGGGGKEGRWLEDSGGEPPSLTEHLGRGFVASSRGSSANPQLAG